MKREDQFARAIVEEFGPVKPFEPFAYYDPDGDCIEFHVSNEAFCAERLDRWVTVYASQTTGEFVGGLVKDIGKLMKRFPGLVIELDAGQVKIACVLRAPAWSTEDPIVRKRYKKVIQAVEEESLTADYACAGA